jgi:hypothetical protein
MTAESPVDRLPRSPRHSEMPPAALLGCHAILVPGLLNQEGSSAEGRSDRIVVEPVREGVRWDAGVGVDVDAAGQDEEA